MADRLRATALAAVVLAWSAVKLRIPPRWNPLPQAVFGTAMALLARPLLGLRPPTLWAGLRWGGAAAVPVLASVAAATAIPAVRDAMAAGARPPDAGRWLLLRIPVGTVWAEEAAYRAAAGTAAERAFGVRVGRLVAAATFGLSHIPDARSSGTPVVGTVLVTGAAGWLFSWLYDESGSLAAPMIAHLAVNEAGAVAALAVSRRRRSGRGRRAGAARSSGRRSRS
ncbi:CPBP family intramembrane glutamic endopeptidase [Mycobacterium sp. ITM-2016-00317]|uniref:Rv0804 family intramembrane glutamic endopeptidase n=1 Tax=Mycobacterium sp. ITM-2016-00317 TaxID=2099694 RepID=UPI000D491D5A|nr:CPBP family intramembrane glutamic endopeptidase [Mycobacterium sp. ITM-2016-00317]WNG86842.1 CPBP family intramembrane glutamic endopeptidase [Mycobacterium sp. ITM-2016-00317]